MPTKFETTIFDDTLDSQKELGKDFFYEFQIQVLVVDEEGNESSDDLYEVLDQGDHCFVPFFGSFDLLFLFSMWD